MKWMYYYYGNWIYLPEKWNTLINNSWVSYQNLQNDEIYVNPQKLLIYIYSNQTWYNIKAGI